MSHSIKISADHRKCKPTNSLYPIMVRSYKRGEYTIYAIKVSLKAVVTTVIKHTLLVK